MQQTSKMRVNKRVKVTNLRYRYARNLSVQIIIPDRKLAVLSAYKKKLIFI